MISVGLCGEICEMAGNKRNKPSRTRKCGAKHCGSVGEKLFSLPKWKIDKRSPETLEQRITRCKTWLINSGRLDLLDWSWRSLEGKFFICCSHFTDDQFYNYHRLNLLPKAIPTIFDNGSKGPVQGAEVNATVIPAETSIQGSNNMHLEGTDREGTSVVLPAGQRKEGTSFNSENDVSSIPNPSWEACTVSYTLLSLSPTIFNNKNESLLPDNESTSDTSVSLTTKCFEQFVNILLVVRRHRILLWNMICDTLLWILWLLLVLVIILTHSKNNFYFFTTHINDMFLAGHETRTQEARNITDYRQHVDLIEYMKTTFILNSVAYPDSVDPEGTAVKLMLDGQNYIIGIPTIRQIRVVYADLDYCDAPKELRPPECFRPYKLQHVDSEDYGEKWSKYKGSPTTDMDKIWMYSTWQDMRSFYLMDDGMNFYPGGGYVIHLSDNYVGDIEKIDYIRDNMWLDYRTRLLVFDVTLYAPAYESFVDLHICISQSRLGAFQYFSQIDVIRPTMIDSLEDVFGVISIWLAICLGSVMLHRFFFVPRHSVKIIAIKILNYAILSLSFLTLLDLLVTGVVFRKYLNDSDFSDPLFFQGFSYIGWLNTAQSAAMALLLIASTIRCAYAFKHLTLFKVMMKTMHFALKSVLCMYLLLLIALIQFGTTFAMLMGHASVDFHSPAASVWCLIAFIVDSNNNYGVFYELHFYYSVAVQIVRWVMVLFIYFFFVNLMLAIFTSMFHLALQAVLEQERTEMTVTAFVKGKVRRLLHINRITLHEEARQIALNKLTKMVVRERPLAARYPGVDTLRVSLSALHAVDTIVDRFGNHHVHQPQENLDHAMATIIRNKTSSDQPTSPDDTIKLIRVFSLDGPKLVSAERLSLVARRLNIRQSEPILQMREIRTELADEVVQSIRDLLLHDDGDATLQVKKTVDETKNQHQSVGTGIRESSYFRAFSPYFPSIYIRLQGGVAADRFTRNAGGAAKKSGIAPRAELILSEKMVRLHMNKRDPKESGSSEVEAQNRQDYDFKNVQPEVPREGLYRESASVPHAAEMLSKDHNGLCQTPTSLATTTKFLSLLANNRTSEDQRNQTICPRTKRIQPPTFLSLSSTVTKRLKTSPPQKF